MAHSKNPPPIYRFITGHSEGGESVFEPRVTSEVPIKEYPGGMRIAFCFATQGFPVDLEDDKDLGACEQLANYPPGKMIPNGTAAKLIDFPPGYPSPMHRSMSINYNFVIEGQVECISDSGETRLLKQGDFLMQRAVMHSWRNTSGTTWAKITTVVFPVKSFAVDGKTLEARPPQ